MKSKEDGLIEEQKILAPPENWENWRKKSLNPNPLEKYSLPLLQTNSDVSSTPGQADQGQMGPIPKLIKINDKVFCVLLNNSITLFKYLTPQERTAKKLKNTFIKQPIDRVNLPNKIKWVLGESTNRIYIGGQEQILILQIGQELGVNELWRKQFKKIKGFSFLKTNMRQQLLVLTENSILTFKMDHNFEPSRQMPIKFSDQSTGQQSLQNITGIQLIVENYNTFYYVGTSMETKASARKKLGKQVSSYDENSNKKCEVLFIAQFVMSEKEADARIFIIDYIFESGIFKKSRAYQLGPQTFILALYEEIIVIRRKFSKFMVWDNVSVVSSKGSEKKGQLVLAEKRIMIYREIADVHSHELFFDFSKAKFQTPKIDSFRSNDSEQQILYDALIFQYKPGNFMKVLYFFKQAQIYMPNKKFIPNTENGPKDTLSFQLVCTEQTEPTVKLKQLFQKNKAPDQIDSFVKRFHIQKLRVEKSKWQVSEKGLKQIQCLLMEIKDNDYIQEQLTKILKQKPHDLNFLLLVEKKQIQRYRNMIAGFLLKLTQVDRSNKDKNVIIDSNFTEREVDQIKLAIQWLLESKMFEKKLIYSQNFLSFKQYDFIEIGKLKAASLREQIKLLGCKGFQKRLKYFFNSFKYLVLDDFKKIIRFVIYDLSEAEMKQFFCHNFSYILPLYEQSQQEDQCLLWQDSFETDEKKIETKQMFRQEIIKEMNKIVEKLPKNFTRISLQKATSSFDQFFGEFIESDWFVKNSYKQHSLLSKNLTQLQSYFQDLKQFQVCNIIVEVIYQKIDSKQYNEKNAKSIITTLKKAALFNDVFTFNVEARIKVFEFITAIIAKNRRQYMDLEMPQKSNFIILKEEEYFDILFQNFRQYLLVEIKKIYEQFETGFFLTRLQKYLYSEKSVLSQLIEFLDFFNSWDTDQVRVEVFTCITKKLKLTDGKNARNFINKLMDKAVFEVEGKKLSLEEPIDEAKVAFTEYFINFFDYFQIDATYNDLLKETKKRDTEGCKILKKIIQKFGESYHRDLKDIVSFQTENVMVQDQLPDIAMNNVMDFLSFLLYFRSTLNFKLEQPMLLQKLIQQFLKNRKFDEISLLFQQLYKLGIEYHYKQLIMQFQHYQLLSEFKANFNNQQTLQKTVLDWVQSKFVYLSQFDRIKVRNEETQETIKEQENENEQQIQDVKKEDGKGIKQIQYHKVSEQLTGMTSGLRILNSLSLNDPKINKFIDYLSLLNQIKPFSPNYFLAVIKKEVESPDYYCSYSSFNFMIDFLDQLDFKKLNIREFNNFIENKLKKIQTIHRYFVKTFQKAKKNKQVILGEFCRINSELAYRLIDAKYFRSGAFSLMHLFNSDYYYRDLLAYFLARIIPAEMEIKVIEKLIYEFMNNDDLESSTIILSDFVKQYELQTFVDDKTAMKNAKNIFKCVLINNQLDQAFFSLVRNQAIGIPQMEALCLSMNKYPDALVYIQALLITYIRIVKKYGENQLYPSFMLYKSKLNSLTNSQYRMDVLKDIFIILSQLKIDIGQLKEARKIQQYQKDHDLLNHYYQKFMSEFENGRKIKITLENIQTTAKRYNDYLNQQQEIQEDEEGMLIQKKSLGPSLLKAPVQSPSIILSGKNFQSKYLEEKGFAKGRGNAAISEQQKRIMEEKKILREKQKRLREIQQENEKILQTEFKMSISEAKKQLDEKYKAQQEEERKKREEEQANKKDEEDDIFTRKIQIPEDEMQEPQNDIQKINDEEQQKLGEVKSKYHSKLVEDTYKMLEQLKKRRDKMKEETTNFYSGKVKTDNDSQLSGSQHLGGKKLFVPDSPKGDLKNSFMMNSGKNEEMTKSFYKNSSYDVGSQFYVPRREYREPKSLKNRNSLVMQSKQLKNSMRNSGYFIQNMKKQMEDKKKKQQKIQQQKVKPKLTFDQIKEKFVQKEPDTAPTIEKLSLVRNNINASVEVMKNIFNKTKDFINFLTFAEQLLENVQYASQIFQLKAIKTIKQALKINKNLPLKQIFPINLLTSIHHVTLRDYYGIAYGIIRPNLIKLMEDPKFTNSVNGLAVFIRFGFGSDNEFSSKVYEDYLRSLLNIYEKNPNMAEKQLNNIIEKLRNNYNNLSVDKRKVKMQQIIHQISNKELRYELLRKIMKNLQGKSSLVSKDSLQDFRNVIVKTMKDEGIM